MIIDSKSDFLTGEVLVFDKPLYWTSFDLVKKVKNLIRSTYGYSKIKVGHAGTLDPLASGLMIICTGKKTKTINDIQNLTKEYVGTIKLGETTPSFDLETKVDKKFSTDHITRDKVLAVLEAARGEHDQVPPMFSAKNIDGKRAYEYARKGITKVLAPKRVMLYELELLKYDMPYLQLRVKCSKGTYIRSLARDIGIWLDSGAHLTELRRTYIGDYSVDNSITLEEFEETLQSV